MEGVFRNYWWANAVGGARLLGRRDSESSDCPGGPGHGDRVVDGEDREDARGSAEAKCQQAKGKKTGLNNKMRKGAGKGSKTW